MLSFKDISDLFVEIERRLIASLKRNLAGHKDWEKSEGFDWPAWQAEKLTHIERFRQENKSITAEYSDAIDLKTRELMADQFAEGWHQVNDEVPDGQAEGFPLLAKPNEDNFFDVNDHRLDKLIKDMHEGEQTAQTAALRMMDDVYRRTISQAAAAMAAGSATLPQAIDLAVKDFLRAGINCIEYNNGARVNIADYVQMALRTAATRSFLQGEAKRRAELGIDTVLVSQYGACSNTCLPWQGRVYIDDVWGNFQGEKSGDRGKSANGKWYPLLSVAVKAGLFHPNCRHTVSTWIEGVSKLPEPMDDAKVKENAALEQQQRAMERRVRMLKRMAEGLQQPTLVKEYKSKAAQAQKELREFIAEHDDVLRRDYWREKTYDVPIAISREDAILKADIRHNSVLTIDSGKQGKHIRGHNNYIPGRSYLTVSEEEAQQLVNQYAGTGELLRDSNGHWKQTERIDAGKPIGFAVRKDGTEIPTSVFVVHYSKAGTHIVPTIRKEAPK
ncbi:MAG TPA: phage minor capsid protein [Caproiciproducens sp.]|nr:phage minor capsid protein [Caproiciproducens sp.]